MGTQVRLDHPFYIVSHNQVNQNFLQHHPAYYGCFCAGSWWFPELRCVIFVRCNMVYWRRRQSSCRFRDIFRFAPPCYDVASYQGLTRNDVRRIPPKVSPVPSYRPFYMVGTWSAARKLGMCDLRLRVSTY